MEKKITTFTVRFNDPELSDLDGLAAISGGMERSEFIRHLVSLEKEKQHSIWLARNQLFANENGVATHTAHDKVAH